MAEQRAKKRRGSIIKRVNVKSICGQGNMDALNVRPERGEPEYREAIVLDIIPKQHYPWDSIRQGPEAAAPSTRRNLITTKYFLERQRAIRNKTRRKYEKEWSMLRSKQNGLTQTFLRYNKMLKENREKVERAEKKEEEEKIKQAAITLEIEELKESLNYYKKNKQQMKHQISIYTMYETFLTKVIELSSKYDTIEDCSNMYDMMVSARNKISTLETEGDSQLQKTTQDMATLINEKNQEILNINETMKALDLRFDRAHLFTRYWDTLILKCENLVMEKNTERNIVKQMIYELYTNCCYLLGQNADLDRNQMEEQLDVVKNYVHFQRTVLKLAKHYQHELEREDEQIKKKSSKTKKTS